MCAVRYFSGGRDSGKRSAASELMRIEIQKKGKLPATDRYRQIMKKRLAESRAKALGTKAVFNLPGSIQGARKMSKRAEEALKQIAAKKAAKEAKALRRMVIVTPRTYPNGNITQKGKIYDVGGNLVAEVNLKNGNMATTLGWGLGKYKPQSYFTNMAIQDAINKYSPYLINQRKLQQIQANGGHVTSWGPLNGDVINVHGRGGHHHHDSGAGMEQYYGTDAGGPRQNVGVTAWGAQSDNVWGTFADNAWGNSMDNVWGGNSSDVWGGIGVGNLWGAKGQHIWGTGNGKNFLKSLSGHVMAFFGLGGKGSASMHEALSNARNSGSSAHEHAMATRSSGGGHEHAAAPTTRSAPTTTRK